MATNLENRLQPAEITPAEKALKTLPQRNTSFKLVNKHLKFNERMEGRAKEEVHRRLDRGELKIAQENSQKRVIAALIQPKTQPKHETIQPTDRQNRANGPNHFSEYNALRSIQTPVVDKLDPSINFNTQLKKATKDYYPEEATARDFKNCQEQFTKAKKDKMSSVREAQRQLALTKQQEEADLATEKFYQQQLAAGKIKKNAPPSQLLKNSPPAIDQSTFTGKLMILRDVKESKYPMPKNFPTIAEMNAQKIDIQSSHYKKTALRKQQQDSKRDRIQDKFIEDQLGMMPTFRKTTRDYHVEKEHNKLLHGAPIGRYSPSYQRVWHQAPMIEIKGVKDRFGYENKNSPMFVKPAEGQISATGAIQSLREEKRNGLGSKKSLHMSPDLQNRACKTQIQFKPSLLPGQLSLIESGEEVNQMANTGITTKNKLSPEKSIVQAAIEQGLKQVDLAIQQQSPQDIRKIGSRAMSQNPSQKKFPSRQNSISAISMNSGNKAFLPNLQDLKYNSSYLIGQNQNRTVKAVDFMGYAKRKEIYDGLPKPVESRFESPKNLCPLVSSKHKYTAKVEIGKYSPRVFFTDKIRDWPFK